MTIQELQNEFLFSTQKDVDPADFFILLAHTLRKDKVFIHTHPEHDLSEQEEKEIRENLLRRIQHEPIAYITGSKEFYGYDFLVTQATLIPRPETEQMVELAIDYIGSKQQATSSKQRSALIVDIGTGSGDIIISLAKEIEKRYLTASVRYHASDISEDALAVAKENAKRHHVDDIIEFHESDLLGSIPEEIFSADEIIITANLPYVSQSFYENTPPDVHDFEPRTALVSGEAGLAHYYRLLKNIRTLLLPRHSFILFFEISEEQSSSIVQRIHTLFPQAHTKIYPDLAGKDRVAEIHIRG